MQYRKEQLQLQQEAKQQAKEQALEQEKEKQRRLDKLREQACGVIVTYCLYLFRVKSPTAPYTGQSV